MGGIRQDGFGLIHSSDINDWIGKINDGVDANSLYEVISSIPVGPSGSNLVPRTAFISLGGNDATAEFGNPLKPYLTVQAASEVLLANGGDLMYFYPGTGYELNDTNAPFGLLPPGHQYNIFLPDGCIISYTGTYGVFIAGVSLNNSGSIFGNGTIFGITDALTGTVDNVSGSLIIFNATSGFQFRTPTLSLKEVRMISNAPLKALSIGEDFGAHNVRSLVKIGNLSNQSGLCLQIIGRANVAVYINEILSESGADYLVFLDDSTADSKLDIIAYIDTITWVPVGTSLSSLMLWRIYQSISSVKWYNCNIYNNNPNVQPTDNGFIKFDGMETPNILMNNVVMIDYSGGGITNAIANVNGTTVNLKMPNVLTSVAQTDVTVINSAPAVVGLKFEPGLV